MVIVGSDMGFCWLFLLRCGGECALFLVYLLTQWQRRVVVCACGVVWHAENPVRTFKTSPHHARMWQHVWAWCRYTLGRFERTHGEMGGEEGVSVTHQHQHQHTHTTAHQQHTQTHNTQHRTRKVSSPVLLTKICSRRVVI